MSNVQTSVVATTIALGSNPDAVELDTRDGHLILVLAAGVDIVLDHADQDTLDKLATVTAKAAAVKRARSLRQVA
ncbi:hypothetical protein F7R91_14350 [Streptomyces luteolifulvus]|uniref:Uncharacterized protein n=1 Tax=Streptomyces luteolifulvus TaxID=2615112 RepID=A0A6H9V3I0_9ACTN|nr:hypothetical protein [Streptomyces luteolifulvus]KAB1146757.1 hypothetical protein F7R91_14350 [Streptomyces luteolifulvus]